MIKYLTSISTATTVVDMLQNEDKLQNIKINAKVFNRSLTQQGFTLFHAKSDIEFNITENAFTNEIMIQVVFNDSKNSNLQSLDQDHYFDRDFDKAVNWLSKEIVKTFPDIWS